MNHFHSFSKKSFTNVLEDYEKCEKPLDTGGNHYKATFTPLNVKVMMREVNLSSETMKMYENECFMNAILSHPNLMFILYDFTLGDILYSVLPYTPYQSVDVLALPNGLPESVIGFVIEDVVKAVDYLHCNNIIHRSINASNIYLYGSSATEFKFVLTELKHCYNMQGQLGVQCYSYPQTAQSMLKYLAPEVLEQNVLYYNFKADIYAIGILCCHLANGIAPFDNMPSDEVLLHKIIGDTPKPLDSSCQEMILFKEYADQVESSISKRYNVYCNRNLSKPFHDFTQNMCLHMEPAYRSTANQLLNHEWIQSIDHSKQNEIISAQFAVTSE